MHNAKNNLLSNYIQKLFKDRGTRYFLRGAMLKQPCVWTTPKNMCISDCGVTLWNGLGDTIKQFNSINQFKKRYKKTILDKYKMEDKQSMIRRF